ncbi:hypothetical protein [Brevibacillus sp. HD1.4A]|uniref:hypothetical protein n=1 Tax=Brevibacillus sp. HD1.4A TaxID=2738978 RepID=UPI00156B475A|nr:hypothetical protein [Brevibacillus sp. HD1.4A]NRQ51959.1 hypothetical protein [Brevibacillus sp. HD1.4A]
MSRLAPNRYGTDMRAPVQAVNNECITRPMTPAERAWMDSLPKPQPKERIIGMSIAAEKVLKRRHHSG